MLPPETRTLKYHGYIMLSIDLKLFARRGFTLNTFAIETSPTS